MRLLLKCACGATVAVSQNEPDEEGDVSVLVQHDANYLTMTWFFLNESLGTLDREAEKLIDRIDSRLKTHYGEHCYLKGSTE